MTGSKAGELRRQASGRAFAAGRGLAWSVGLVLAAVALAAPAARHALQQPAS